MDLLRNKTKIINTVSRKIPNLTRLLVLDRLRGFYKGSFHNYTRNLNKHGDLKWNKFTTWIKIYGESVIKYKKDKKETINKNNKNENKLTISNKTRKIMGKIFLESIKDKINWSKINNRKDTTTIERDYKSKRRKKTFCKYLNQASTYYIYIHLFISNFSLLMKPKIRGEILIRDVLKSLSLE